MRNLYSKDQLTGLTIFVRLSLVAVYTHCRAYHKDALALHSELTGCSYLKPGESTGTKKAKRRSTWPCIG